MRQVSIFVVEVVVEVETQRAFYAGRFFLNIITNGGDGLHACIQNDYIIGIQIFSQPLNSY